MSELPASGKPWHMLKSNLDKSLAIGGIAAGIGITFLLSQIAPSYISVGLIFSIACAVYLVLTRRNVAPLERATTLSSPLPLHLLLNILFLLLLICSMIMLYIGRYERPLGYFISISLMSALVALEVFSAPQLSEKRSALVLVKILIISLSLRWSLFYIYPGSMLGVDPWGGAVLFDKISQAGHLIPEMGGYYHMPIEHIMVVSTSQFLGVGAREAMILSLSLVETMSLIFVFLLGKHLFNARIGLLATLILGVNNVHIQWGWWLVAQTVGISIAAIVLFLILTPGKRETASFKAICILALIILILTHTVSSFVVLAILIAQYLGHIAYSSFRHLKTRFTDISGSIALFFGVALLSYWTYISHSLAYFTTMALGRVEVSSAITNAPAVQVISVWEEINKLCSLLFYALAIVGVLWVFNQRNLNSLRFKLVISGIIVTGIIFAGSFFDIGAEVLIDRWFVFAQMLLAIPAALGLVLISSSNRRGWGKQLSLAALTFLLAFLMITNTIASFDSPLYPSYLEEKAALMISELRASDTIAFIYQDPVSTDAVYARAFLDSPKTPAICFTYKEMSEEFAEAEGLLLVRRSTLHQGFLVTSEKAGYVRVVFTYDPYQALASNGLDIIYDAGTVSAHLRPAQGP